MSTIQFEEEQQQYTSRRILGERVQPGMISFLMKLGVAKKSTSAARILFGIAFISFIAAGVILFSSGNEDTYQENIAKMEKAVREATGVNP